MNKEERTIYCGSLSEKVTEDLLYELFLQAGPLESVKIPKSRNFGFITFKHDVSVPYAMALMQGLCLFGREIRLELRTGASNRSNPFVERIEAHKNSVSRAGNPYSSSRPQPGPHSGWKLPDSRPHYGFDGNGLKMGHYSNGPLQNRSFSDVVPLLGRQAAFVNYTLNPAAALLRPPIQHGYSPYPIKDGRVFQDRNRRFY